jgi:hypothetical protein
MFAPALVFGIVVMLGLLAAKRPQVFVRYFLPPWQRVRVVGKMSEVSWTGWGIFGLSALGLIVMFIADILAR